MENSEEKKPVEETKSSMEILSELFSTFNAEPPIIIKEEKQSSKKSKKSKKKHKHKEKKHKKKSKKRKRSRSRSRHNISDDYGDESKLDLAKILVKRGCQFPEKKLKLDLEEMEAKIEPIKTKNEKIKRETDEKSNEYEDRGSTESNDNKSLTEKQNNTNGNSQSENKIKIQNLKFSSIFNQAVLDIHEKKKDFTLLKDNLSLSDCSENADLSEGEIPTSKKHKHKKSHKHHNIDSEKKSEKHNHRKKETDKQSHKHRHSRDQSKEKSSKSRREHDKKEKIDKHMEDYDLYKKYKSKETDDYKSRYRDDNKDHDKEKDNHKTKYHEDLKNKTNKDFWNRRHHKEDSVKKGNKEKWCIKERCKSHDELEKEYDRKHRDRSRERDRIDKRKLLEIARKNAIQMMNSGSLPAALTLGPQAQEKVLAAIRAGGKTIEELTDFCKTLSKKEELGELSSISEDENDSDTDKPFHHPFQIKDRPTSIVMNIKNSVPLPIKTSQERSTELRMQFPVSSGQQHRKTENEWVPVSPKKSEIPVAVIPKKPNVIVSNLSPEIPAIPAILPTPVALPGPQVFPTQTEGVMDIGSIVSQRLSAMRKLQENPNDVQALSEMYKAQKEMQTWAESKQQPGQFTGSTGAQILSQEELSSGFQAWAKKDQLQTAAPVSGGMGMHLLQKMGWKPGEGLGKEKTGTLEPLLLEVKLDKKGLVTNDEQKRKQLMGGVGPKVPIKTLEGKHPVSLLGEYAAKRKLGAPIYQLCEENGPDHKKTFLFKVILNGIEYKPPVSNFNKKQAKKDAAELCLQQIGLLPRALHPQPTQPLPGPP